MQQRPGDAPSGAAGRATGRAAARLERRARPRRRVARQTARIVAQPGSRRAMARQTQQGLSRPYRADPEQSGMKTVFVDVDTQIDFLFPAGALYVPGAERLLPAIVRLNHFAAAQGIPLISTTDAHSEDDPEFRQWPPHCVAGTSGQLKPGETLLASRTTLGFQPGALIELAPQIIVEKHALDVFT